MGGHTIERVPLDFDWPLDQIWKGYVNPHSVPCDPCDGHGDTIAAQWLDKMVYLMAMLGDWGADRRGAHPWFGEIPLAPLRLRREIRDLYPPRSGKMPPPGSYEVQRPGSDMADLIRGLIGKPPYSIEQYPFTQLTHHISESIVGAAGVPKKWGICPDCKGTGIDAAHYKDYKRWRSKKPPRGRGWQVWENVSEGSPITPVFATSAELVDYLATKGTTWDQRRAAKGWGGGGPWRREAAEQFVKDGGFVVALDVQRP